MKRIAVSASAILIALAALAARPSVATAASSLASPAIRNAIVAAVKKERTTYGGRTPVPGVLVGVWDGSGRSFVHGFGYADLATHRPMSAADHFRIGSNTKTFVVATILQLADEKKLTLDEPISRFHLGITIPNASRITVRQLCDMRSGLYEMYAMPALQKMLDNPNSKYTPRLLISAAVKHAPYFAPGTAYHYSNTNYIILGLIIEKVTHDSVGNEIRKRFIIPFDLTQTSYPSTQAMPAPWAHGYGLDAHRNWEDVSGTVPVAAMGAAGLMISDLNDMHHWITAYVSGKTSGPATSRALLTCLPTGEGNLSFGLGLGCSAGWYGYTGGLPGYNTANYYFPARRVFVLVWVDAQMNDPRPGVANAIVHDIAAIMTPHHVPFQLSGAAGHSGL